MAENPTKNEVTFDKGIDKGTVDELREGPDAVINMTWVEENATQTRPPYKWNTLATHANFDGIRHTVSDGESAFYQSERGKIVLADAQPGTQVWFDDTPPVDVSMFVDDGSSMSSNTCSCAVSANYVAVTFENIPATDPPRVVCRVYDRTTKELIAQEIETNGQQPRVALSGDYFVFVYQDTNFSANLKMLVYDAVNLGLFSSTATPVTDYTGSFFEIAADSTSTYVAYGNTTPRLTVKKITSSTQSVTGTYTHGTLDAVSLGIVEDSGSLFVAFDDGAANNLVVVKITSSTMVQAATLNAQTGTMTLYERISLCVYNDGTNDRLTVAAQSPSANPPQMVVNECDINVTTFTGTTNIYRVSMVSKLFPHKNGTAEQPMVVLADHNAENSLQNHLVLCGLREESFTTIYGWSSVIPAAVLSHDEANTNNGTALDDYMSYSVAQDGTNSGIYYFSCLRQTGFDAASGSTPGKLWGVRTYKLDMSMDKALCVERFDGQAHTSGGLMTHPQPGSYMESSVVGSPYIEGSTLSAGALTGSYGYRAVWEVTDSRGKKIRSFPSPLHEVSLTAQQASLTITAPRFSVTDDVANTYSYALAVYRTLAGGSLFHLVDRFILESTGNASLGAVTFADNTTDVLVGVGELLRHGITGGDLGPIVPPAAEQLFTWRDRLCLVSAEDGRLWYSMPNVINRGPEFNPALSWSIPNDPVAGAQLNNNAIVFAADAIYVCSGSQGDAAGRGQSIAVQQISRTVGCTNRNSVITGSRGVYFQSKRGLELLTPDYEILRIRGLEDQLVTSTAANPLLLHSTARDPNTDEICFLLARSNYFFPRIYRLNETNMNLSYDSLPATAAATIYHIAAHKRQLRLMTGTSVQNWAETAPDEDKGADIDNASNLVEIAPEYTSQWFQVDGPQGDQELQSVLLKFRMASNNGTPSRSTITFSEFYDHSDAIVATKSLSLGTLSTDLNDPALHQVRVIPTRHRCQAFRFAISYSGDGSDGNTVVKLLSGRLEIGVVAGGARVTPTPTT